MASEVKSKNIRPVLILGLGLGILLALAALIYFNPFAGPAENQAYLDHQSAALLPEFHRDLQGLARAPRYTIRASIDPEGQAVSGEMTLVYTNTTPESLSELAFRLYPNASSIYGGGELTVRRVLHDDIQLQTEISGDRTILRVFLDAPLNPNEIATLDLSFDAQIPSLTTQGYGIFSQSGGVTALAGWYPLLAPYQDGWVTPPVPDMGDAMLAEISFYEVKLAAPAGYQLASTGTVVEQETGQERTTWRIVSGPVREFALALSQRFDLLETQAGAVTLRLFILPVRNPVTLPQEGLDIIVDAFNAFEQRFGPYPYKEFEVVETVVSIGGYEFPGMVYLDDGLRAEEPVDEFAYLVAHETSHQWWYNLVGNHTVNQPWLDEAHAAYGGALYFEHAESARAGELFLANWQNAYGERTSGEPPVNSSALEFSAWPPYREAVYVHGALFLDQLRRQMGDQKFFEFLHRFQETHRYEIASTADYFNLAEEVAGEDLDSLFMRWFDMESINQ